ncbi:anaphase-promoting complex subunit 4-like [Tropilaelaps mercedesae]|uniref:Anaphase-promoting complex subunit 4 n=1 Tax=Tropilaelaps mercedesae TaxID=418985 RepID=A0A1V9X7R5_9ACAR|nr:anaphase-promoting complex subunit 4-like [Tropilaelaps mercedesae]
MLGYSSGQMAPFQQLEDKSLSGIAHLMAWSPRMDLLAVALESGEVVVHRHRWQKVWTRPKPRDDGVGVRALYWKPNGQLLAIAYSDCRVELCHVEQGDVVHRIKTEWPVTGIHWLLDPDRDRVGDVVSQDNHPSELEPLQNLKTARPPPEKVPFNMMLCLSEKMLQLYLHGTLPCGAIQAGDLLCASMSHDAERIFGVNRSGEYIFCCTPLLKEKLDQLQTMAYYDRHINYLDEYLGASMSLLRESWDNIILQMDSKLINFSQGASLSDDLLELVVFGTPSATLRDILLNKVTPKGLQKLSVGVEACYSNLTKVLSRHILPVCHRLFFHVEQMKGLASWKEYALCSISLGTLERLSRSLRSFMLKVLEFQQVSTWNLGNLKTFFRWLSGTALFLTDEGVPESVFRHMEGDLAKVSAYLVCSKENDLTLDQVGQYLSEHPLKMQIHEFGIPILSELGLSEHRKETSLMLEYVQLKESIKGAFEGLGVGFTKDIQPRRLAGPIDIGEDCIHSQLVTETSVLTCIVPSPESQHLIVFRDEEFCVLKFGAFFSTALRTGNEVVEEPKAIVSAQLYSGEVITLLLRDTEHPQVVVLAQFPLSRVEQWKPVGALRADWRLTAIDAGSYIDKMNHRVLDRCPTPVDVSGGQTLAVSGSRNLCCVRVGGRRMRLLEMDVNEDEEDEEDEDETNETGAGRAQSAGGDANSVMMDASRQSQSEDIDVDVVEDAAEGNKENYR